MLRKRSHTKRLLFTVLAVSFLLCLLALFSELGLRKFSRRYGNDPLTFFIDMQGTFHRQSAIPGLIYELRPGATGEFRGAQVRINSYGFRGPEFSPQKAPDTCRILGLGDSITFGLGVAYDDTYLVKAGALLRAMAPDKQIEVINAGCSGYNAKQELILFQNRGLALDPDLIVIGFWSDDFSPAYLHPKMGNLLDRMMLHSALFRFLAAKSALLKLFSSQESYWREFTAAGHDDIAMLQPVSDLIALCRSHDIDLIYIIHPKLGVAANGAEFEESLLKKKLIAEHIPFCEAEQSYLAVNPDTAVFSANLNDDPHPNARGHVIVARKLAETIAQEARGRCQIIP